jgi:SAM-dependent methyltransferase
LRGTLAYDGRDLRCEKCGGDFVQVSGAFDLTPEAVEDKNRIVTFWGDTYKQWYGERDLGLTEASLRKDIVDAEDCLRIREHVAVVEMGRLELAGKNVLEIGSGAGGHSALFRGRGASMTSVDITPERVFATPIGWAWNILATK